MRNVTMVIGRLVSDPKISETENGSKKSIITIAIPRDYKNQDGIYETDFIPVTLYGQLAATTNEYCRKGDLIGIKGRIESIDGKLKIIAEKATFLSTGVKND